MVQVGVESENGWQPADLRPGDPRLAWFKVPGADVTLQLQVGIPAAMLLSFAGDFNAYIEPLRDADSAAYTDGNQVFTSNHKNATGMDLNWNGADGQTFRYGISEQRAYPGAKAAALRELLDWYEGMVYCGGFWDIRDWMHFQLGAGTYQDQDRCRDFIRRKIRADGFSTFRRGGADTSTKPVHETVTLAAVDVLVQAAGITAAKAREILPTLAAGLALAEATTARRIGMDVAQWGHESDGFNTTVEYADGSAYEGRADLGNTQPGDGRRFRGRGWIQCTGRHNYGQFSRWAFERGLVPTPTYFVDRPDELADLRWAGTVAAWYTVSARPQINGLADAGDVREVTRLINGGYTHLDQRIQRYERAMALGDDLLQLLTEGDDMFDDHAYDLLKQVAEYRRPSLSPLRWPNEGNVNTCAGFAWTSDALAHVSASIDLATVYGHAPTIAMCIAVANTTETNRDDDIRLAKRILAKVPPADLEYAKKRIQQWLDAEAKQPVT